MRDLVGEPLADHHSAAAADEIEQSLLTRHRHVVAEVDAIEQHHGAEALRARVRPIPDRVVRHQRHRVTRARQDRHNVGLGAAVPDHQDARRRQRAHRLPLLR